MAHVLLSLFFVAVLGLVALVLASTVRRNRFSIAGAVRGEIFWSSGSELTSEPPVARPHPMAALRPIPLNRTLAKGSGLAKGPIREPTLEVLGREFARLWPAVETARFGGLLEAIDEADRKFRSPMRALHGATS